MRAEERKRGGNQEERTGEERKGRVKSYGRKKVKICAKGLLNQGNRITNHLLILSRLPEQASGFQNRNGGIIILQRKSVEV